ncbi:MAG: protein kinase [SAR324 cluster bacterium]|nr:protein kinase [SAR324 cluster bacterium]
MLKHSSHIGQILADRYEIKELLGEGGMGQVFRVWDRQAREERAIKLVDVRKKKVPLEAILRFKAEAETLQSLRHESIIRYEDFFHTEDLYGLVMEYEESPSLLQYFSQIKHVPIPIVASLFKNLAEALMYIHSQGVVHHDLKGSNILFTADDQNLRIKLLDFGFSKLIGASENRIGGTLVYMAPEQTGILQKSVDHRADLYSLGIIIYQALTGTVPFLNDDPAILIHQHIAQAPQPPSALRPETPPILEKIVLKLLRKDPDDRYRTTSGLFNDLVKYKRLAQEQGARDVSFELGEEDHWKSFPQVNPVVGRGDTMKALQGIIEDTVARKKGGFVVLEGIQGIGKTTVLKQFFNSIQGEVGKSWFLSIRKEEYELPFKLLKTLFSQVVVYLKNMPEAQQQETIILLKENFGEYFELFLELVPELQPWMETQNEFAGGRSWKDTDYEELLFLFLQAVSQKGQRLLLFIDPLQHVESSSLQCLMNCVERLSEVPVLILLSCTQEEVPAAYRERIMMLQESPFFYRLNLAPLTEKNYAALLQQLFSNQLYETPALIDPLYDATQGNPSLLRKLLQELIDAQRIFYQTRNWEVQLDETLNHIQNYKARETPNPLDQFCEKGQAILLRGSVFLRAFTLEALKAVSKSPPAIEITEMEILGRLDRAVQTGVLSVDSKRLYAFRDNRVRQRLREQLPLRVRQNLHEGIARHLEEYVLPKSAESIYDIAYHWEKSGNVTAAMEYNLKAARLTDDGIYNNQKSEIYYRLALKWLKEIPPELVDPRLQFEVRFKSIRHTFYQSNQYDQLWKEVMELENWVGDDKAQRIQFLQTKAILSFVRDRKDLTFQYGQEALALYDSPEDERYISGIYNMLGRIASDKSYAERTDLLTRGIEMACRYHDFREVGPSLTVLSILMAYQGRFAEAKQMIEDITQNLENSPLPANTLKMFALACLEIERGNFHDVLKIKKNPAFNMEMNRVITMFYQWRFALAHGMQGEFKEAIQLFDQLLAENSQKKYTVQILDLLLARIQLALRMEEPETALYYLNRASLSAQRYHPDPYLQAMLAIQAGLTHLLLDQLEEAAQYLEEQATPIAKQLDSILLNTHLQFALTKLHWQQTKSPQFLEEANQVLIEMLEHGITGYYEIYKDDLNSWSKYSTDSSSQLSTLLSSNVEIVQLMEVSRKMTAALELESLADTILEGAMKMVGAEQGYLFFCDNDWDPSQSKLLPTLLLTRNIQGDVIPINKYVFSKSIVRTVLDSKAAVITRDARNEKLWEAMQSIQDCELRSILAVPILLQHQIKGILYLDNHHASSVFSFRDKEIVEVFAVQAAIAINNAQIYEREQEARQQTEATLRAFERFIPHQFTTRFAQGNIENLTTGLSQQETLSILFSDIRGFTSLSETMNPDDIFKFLNAYLLRMDGPIRRHEGFVDKYIGDAIMALFDQSPQDAVQAGIDMLATLTEYNASRIDKDKMPIEIGIGINTGEVMLGVIGSQERTDTTVLGDAVNIASRIESLTKYYGVSFLITGETYTYVSNMSDLFIRLIDEVQVKGKKEATKIYEIYNDATDEVKDRKQKYYSVFQKAFSVYQQGDWESSEKLFWQYIQHLPEDQVASRFVQRCQVFAKFPPATWEGVYKVENK